MRLDDYVEYQRRIFISSRGLIRLLKNWFFPTVIFRQFVEDTRALFEVLFDRTGAEVLVDSSKTPLRILLLKKLGYNVKIVHIVRRFGDVLNSHKKHLRKSAKDGVETELVPKKTLYVFYLWISGNILTALLSPRRTRIKLKYESLVRNLFGTVSKAVTPSGSYGDLLNSRGPFIPEHLVAGSRVRMVEKFSVASRPLGNDYGNLTRPQKIFAMIIDYFYNVEGD